MRRKWQQEGPCNHSACCREVKLSLAVGDDIRLGFFLNPGEIIIRAKFLKFTCLGTNEEKVWRETKCVQKIKINEILTTDPESDEERDS